MSNFIVASQASRGIELKEPLIFELGSSGRYGIDLDDSNNTVSLKDTINSLEMHYFKNNILLPSCSEPEICRHFTILSKKNFCIDTNIYPLGSCTMKYNSKVNEWAARLNGFSMLHPYLPESEMQGGLEIMYDLQNWLSEIGGFFKTSLQPSAGAQGEFLGILIIIKALKQRNEIRHKILIPESAHGTNAASAKFFGLEVVSVRLDSDSCIDLDDIKSKMNNDVVGIMITNPNTLGIFEKNIIKISKIVHSYGGFVYGDGANLNALIGIIKPADSGIDIMHFNLHKTFATPHGGGGPGASAVGASKYLAKFLPSPLVEFNKITKMYYFDYSRPLSVGRIRSFYGNFGIIIRAWVYIREMGKNGLKKATEFAVLNANYVKKRLKDSFNLVYNNDCLHEVVFNDKSQRSQNISTMNIAKRLIDYGIHPPTIYFPLVVESAMMIEPTETETKESLDMMCNAFLSIANESLYDPKTVISAPNNSFIRQINESFVAKNPVLTWKATS